MGFKLRGDRLSIDPALPNDWPSYTLKFRYGRTEFRIEVKNGGERSREPTHLVDDAGVHTIQVQADGPGVEA